MADPQVNFFRSTLVGTYSDSDTSITIATGDGALLPDPSVDGAFNLTIFEGVQVDGNTTFEIVRVTARSGDLLTVTRGAESTTPLTIGSATHSILMSATKKTFDDINTAIQNIDLTTIAGAESITFDSTGDEEFGLPAGTTAQRPSSPSAGYMRYNTETAKLEIYSGGVWGLVSLENVRVMQTAQLSVTANDAVAENAPIEVEYLVIAGGGGGGEESNGDGGGGAGGYRSSVSGESSGGGASAESVFTADLSTSYTVTVGAGGAGGSSSDGAEGSNSVFSSITSTGGGGGSSSPVAGGSGGGGTQLGAGTTSGGAGTAGQGYSGGSGTSDNSQYRAGGGGGGASEGGANATSTTGGDGGDGVSSSITGSSVTRAGGGGGGAIHGALADTGGSGGAGGGGNGGSEDAVASGSNAVANTGSGGGGKGGNSAGVGGNGGSGVVILRYPSDYTITIGAGLTASTSTVGANKVTTFTAGTGNVSWS